MKTCDFCGEASYSLTELFKHLQTDKVKLLCYDCAEIVDRYA